MMSSPPLVPQSAVVVVGVNAGTDDDDEPDPTDVANALHLDQLEASDAMHDITSFQDIDMNHDDDASSVISSDIISNTYDQYGRVRRPKKLYYLAPMLQKYKYWMGGGTCTLALFFLLLTIIGLSRSVQQQQNSSTSMDIAPQQQQQDEGSEEVGRGKMSVSDAPYPMMTDDNAVVVDETGEEILTSSTEDDTFTTFTTTNTATATTTTTIEGVNWYQTTNIEYLSFLSNNAVDINGLSTTSIAKLFCQSRNINNKNNNNNTKLCPYTIYCPNGYGQLPYPNGPPTYDHQETTTTAETSSSKTWSALDEQQWSPYLHPDDIGGNYWVQVGFIPPIVGGHVDNGYGQCYTAGIWNNQRIDEYNGSIVDEVDGSNRRYVLCCDE